MFYEIKQCRVCKNPDLYPILDLGNQVLTGTFPNSIKQNIPSGPVSLVKCHDLHRNKDVCGLLQLKQTYDPTLLYGKNYGYRSSLNLSMRNHLHSKVEKILAFGNLMENDLIIDIGSNDCTTLSFYPTCYKLLGVDPAGDKFKSYYPDHINLISDFFTYDNVDALFPGKKAKVITSFSMFYDLENPLSFMKAVAELLADDGIWVFEQSYLPDMIQQNAFDTICHEHLEYYSLSTLHWMCRHMGLKIIDIEFNHINGGSISMTVSKQSSAFEECTEKLFTLLEKENKLGFNQLKRYEIFSDEVRKLKQNLENFFKHSQAKNIKIFGLGASTKGNVLLQYCNIDNVKIPYIGEVNEDKFGCYTPGTHIPIIPEQELFKLSFDYLFILPWHFKPFFDSCDKYIAIKNKFIYPLPVFDII